jgi:hypothetical protein
MNVEFYITVLATLVGALVGSQVVMVTLLSKAYRRIEALEERTAPRQPTRLSPDIVHATRALHSRGDL